MIEFLGFNKYLFRTGLKEPVSLTIAGKNIFWTQRGSNRLFWADKNNIHQKNEAALLREFICCCNNRERILLINKRNLFQTFLRA